MVWPPFHSVVQVASQALTQGESYCQEVKTAASDSGNQDLDFDRGGDSGICVLDLKMLHCRSEEWSSRWRHVALWHIYSLFASCILLGFFPPMSIFHSLHGCKMLQNTPVVFHSTDRLIAIHIKRGTSSAFVRTQPNIIVMHILDDDVVDILLPCSKWSQTVEYWKVAISQVCIFVNCRAGGGWEKSWCLCNTRMCITPKLWRATYQSLFLLVWNIP